MIAYQLGSSPSNLEAGSHAGLEGPAWSDGAVGVGGRSKGAGAVGNPLRGIHFAFSNGNEVLVTYLSQVTFGYQHRPTKAPSLPGV